MYSYRAYGLDVEADFPIPEFVTSRRPFDVVIRLNAGCAKVGGDAPSYVLHGESAVLQFPEAGIFEVRKGCEVTITSVTGADLSLLRLFLVGKVMGTLLYQRGLAVLHASCVEIDGQAVVFIGTSCIGKSSLAATLYTSGATVVADDVAAVDFSTAVPHVIPAFPQLKVDPVVAASLGYDLDRLILLDPKEGRRGLRVDDRFAERAAPLGLIYLVGRETPPTPQELLIELVAQTTPTRLLHSGGAPHLQQIARLAQAVPARSLSIADARSAPAALMARIRSDLVDRAALACM